jgi:flagellar hook-length control protein FliK
MLIATADTQNLSQPAVQQPRNVRYTAESARRDGSFAEALDKSASTANTNKSAPAKTETPKQDISGKTDNDLSNKLDSPNELQDYVTETNQTPDVTKDSTAKDSDIPAAEEITGKNDPVLQLTDELTAAAALPILINLIPAEQDAEPIPEEPELPEVRPLTPEGNPIAEHTEVGQLSLLTPEKYVGLNPEIPDEGKFQAILNQVTEAPEPLPAVQPEQAETVQNIQTVQTVQTVQREPIAQVVHDVPEEAPKQDAPILSAPPLITVREDVPPDNPEIITAQTTMVANADVNNVKPLTDEALQKPTRDIFVSAEKPKPPVNTKTDSAEPLEPIDQPDELPPVQPRDGSYATSDDSGEADSGKDSGNSGKSETGSNVSEPAKGQTIDLAPRQVFSQVQAAASDAPLPVREIADVRPNEIFNKLVESAQLVKDVDGSSITMQLKPEHLGKVSLQVALNGEGTLNLKITAEDPNVRGMLNTQMARLVETLSEKGLKIASADVVYTGVADNNYGESNRQQQDGEAQSRRSGRRYTRESILTALDPSTALAGYQPYFGDDEQAMEYVA